jgi:hypothetical protein
MAYFGTTTPLAANGTVTLGPRPTDRADRITGTVFSDQAGTLFIEQSSDGTNWDVSTSVPVTANDGSGFSEELVAPQVRLRYVNGATLQTSFRLFSRFSSAG